MSMMKDENGVRLTTIEKDYSDGRTKQSFKDSTDINKILKKAQKVGSLSHLQKHGAFYGDFANAPKDLFEARELLARGEQIFAELPSEVRKEFGNDPLNYYQFVNDPKNAGDLERVLPAIAEPGKYFPQVNGLTATANESAATADTPVANETPAEGGDTPSGGV